jgi:nitrite reductase/ring-hydroxylating ferredoxin subunit
MAVGGYLGGYLSYSRGVGVNHSFVQPEPDDWTAVIDEVALADKQATKIDAGGATVLLYKDNDRVLAVGSVCSHAGGPLEQGRIDQTACTVECPWHQSVFRLDDGSVVHGPASVPQAAYETRVQDGKIEIRRRS